MIGILVITHGNLGNEFIKSSQLIIGEQCAIKALGLFQGDSIEDFAIAVRKNICEIDEGQGVLVLVDIFGGSPSNVTAINAKEIGDKVNYRCITGVNMPIFLEACTMRESLSLDELTDMCCSAGSEGIKKII